MSALVPNAVSFMSCAKTACSDEAFAPPPGLELPPGLPAPAVPTGAQVLPQLSPPPGLVHLCTGRVTVTPCADATLHCASSDLAKESGDHSDRESCGGLSIGDTMTTFDGDTLEDDSDLDHYFDQGVAEVININPHAWRAVGARIFQSLADLSDDE
mmetsp:Transcript_102300/g.198050  ORF Transcript_102300/g.198050 Transcript_102300/m.198050 type:complete len:156 (-) Transcript_102300:17-484(-)